MRRITNAIRVVGLLALGLILVAGCGREEASTAGGAAFPVTGQAARQAAATGESQIAQRLCPVMGGQIDRKIYLDYSGRRVYFCCQMCVQTFNREPQKYLEKLDAELQHAPRGEPGEYAGGGHGGHENH